jgi:hypothetical protein
MRDIEIDSLKSNRELQSAKLDQMQQLKMYREQKPEFQPNKKDQSEDLNLLSRFN